MLFQKNIVKKYLRLLNEEQTVEAWGKYQAVGRTHRRNRSIQATFWVLHQEYVRSVEFLERTGNVVRQINWNTTIKR